MFLTKYIRINSEIMRYVKTNNLIQTIQNFFTIDINIYYFNIILYTKKLI